ncbi:cation:proton antiporter [Gemmobacter fulvus]|uniref:Cation:proton antiporter n=1 Tax=Gemmobacter fulvus TaxID=2840474 RepID=A0A975S054_9RHOB|nr:cation:proton antiporter [Gemmobacter fulvus]MBT9246992.1 cation:proton antiporter [Gemmobacter fulvus]MDQ1847411.1 cation:proton antiporter [Gemmobacter fulvus]QWK89764.1 cation:proton antiporter [Gemmobacter fulvus]
MDIVLLVSASAALFVVIALSEPVAERLRLPYSVVLAVVGATLGALAVGLRSTMGAELGPEIVALLSLPIRSSVFLYVFLPTLIFQVALGLDLRRMLDDWVPILVMAVAAVLVATLFIGGALAPFSQMSLLACFLIGAIVSTTDPSAVVSIFRSLAAPQRLARIVEGESLLNDAAAIALFGFFLSFVMAGVPNPTLEDAFIGLPSIILGGMLTGWVMARIALVAMVMLGAYPLAQLSLSVAIPYATYVIADHVLGASGVVAVVVAGMTLNWLGPGRLAPATWVNLREVWDLLAHWAGALIFVLASLLIPRLLADARLWDVLLVIVVILAATLARVVMLWGVLPLLARLRVSPQVERPYRIAILWGGLRGAVTLALALAVTENLRVPADIRREVGILATGYTLFTLFAQGTTLRHVIRRLGLAKLTPLDLALSRQVIAVALQNVREEVADTVKEHSLSRDIVRSEAKRFGQRLDQAVSLAEEGSEIKQKDRITLGLLALAGRERDLVLEAFREQEIASGRAEQMLTDVDRLIELTRLAGRIGYRRAARRGLGYGRRYRLAVAAHNRLRISPPLAQMTASRFDILMNQRLILRELHGYIDGKIRRIHGKRVADLLHQVLTGREEDTAQALEGLRLQYPGYAEEMERRFIRRLALRIEEREYDSLLKDGLIGKELHVTLRQSLAEARRRLNQRPRLDLAVQKSAMLRQLPALAGLDAAQLRMVQKRIATVYAQPGDVLIRKGDPARHVYFIASGAVEVEFAGQVQRLGRGEMFGQLGILTRRPRRAQITAITHCTLLSLDEVRFLDLLSRNQTLRQAVEESTTRRGLMTAGGEDRAA